MGMYYSRCIKRYVRDCLVQLPPKIWGRETSTPLFRGSWKKNEKRPEVGLSEKIQHSMAFPIPMDSHHRTPMKIAIFRGQFSDTPRTQIPQIGSICWHASFFLGKSPMTKWPFKIANTLGHDARTQNYGQHHATTPDCWKTNMTRNTAFLKFERVKLWAPFVSWGDPNTGWFGIQSTWSPEKMNSSEPLQWLVALQPMKYPIERKNQHNSGHDAASLYSGKIPPVGWSRVSPEWHDDMVASSPV